MWRQSQKAFHDFGLEGGPHVLVEIFMLSGCEEAITHGFGRVWVLRILMIPGYEEAIM